MFRRAVLRFGTALCLCFLFWHCNNDRLAGGSTETGNALVSGTVVNEAGIPLKGTEVFLVPENFRPGVDSASPFVQITLTDGSGAFEFEKVDSGWYNIEGYNPVSRHRFWANRILVADNFSKTSTGIVPETLRAPAGVAFPLPDSLSTQSGVVSFWGSTQFRNYQQTDLFSRALWVDSLPAGLFPSVYFHEKEKEGLEIATDFNLSPSDTLDLRTWKWFHPDWPHRVSLIIDSGKVTGTNELVDFPVLITGQSLPDTFWSLAQAAGGDLLVTLGDGITQTPREIVSFNPVGKTMEIWARVKKVSPVKSTALYLYFGRDSVLTARGPEVWEAGYAMVHHMEDVTSDSLGDATVNNFGGKKSVGSPPSVGIGKTGSGQVFTGGGNEISFGKSSGLSPGGRGITFSFWMVSNNLLGQNPLFLRGNPVQDTAWTGGISLKTAGEVKGYLFDGATSHFSVQYRKNGIRDSAWHQVTYRVDRLNGGSIFIDGVLAAGPTGRIWESEILFNSELIAGNGPEGSFVGTLDEVRMSHRSRTGPWVLAEFKTQNNPSVFYKPGPLESFSN